MANTDFTTSHAAGVGNTVPKDQYEATTIVSDSSGSASHHSNSSETSRESTPQPIRRQAGSKLARIPPGPQHHLDHDDIASRSALLTKMTSNPKEVMVLSELLVHRTVLCPYLEANPFKRACPLGRACAFSHSRLWPRRDPSGYNYGTLICNASRYGRSMKGTTGPLCEDPRCPFAHTKEEQIFHPKIYKTAHCKYGPGCTVDYCPYAHGFDELRVRPRYMASFLALGEMERAPEPTTGMPGGVPRDPLPQAEVPAQEVRPVTPTARGSPDPQDGARSLGHLLARARSAPLMAPPGPVIPLAGTSPGNVDRSFRPSPGLTDFVPSFPRPPVDPLALVGLGYGPPLPATGPRLFPPGLGPS